MPSDGVPYPVFAFCALLPWQLFAFALTESSNSVVANQRLITKVYFPRLIMPLAAVVRRPRRLRHRVRRPARDARRLLRHRARAGGAAPCRSGRCSRSLTALGGRAVAVGAERPVPRRPLHAAVPHAALAVRDAGRVSDVARAGGVARRLRAQSDGRRRRRIPLGAARHAPIARRRRSLVSSWRSSLVLLVERACSTSAGSSARSRTSSDR